MTKIIKIYLVVFLCGFWGCTKDFESINTNTDQPLVADPSALLPSTILDIADLLVLQSFEFGDVMAQYTAQYAFYTDIDIYNWGGDDRFWKLYSSLQNIEDIKKYSVESGQANYEAIALILRAFCISILTDTYGDVPFSEANKADENILAPVYDTQESIYDGILADLERANDIIETNSNISGDILYQGDMMKWKKFANSLRVRLLMRISNVRSIGSQLQQIVDDPVRFPVFESNTDEAIYNYSGSVPDVPPMNNGQTTAYLYYLGLPTTHIISALSENDPRLEEWFDPWVDANGTSEHIGLSPGLPIDSIGTLDGFSTKDPSYFFESAKINAVLMSFSELNFILAEAAERGVINANAQTYYENGVQASFNQWNLTIPSDFLTSTAPYESGNLDRIYEQKWLALYHTCTEAWFDWKRTGKPDFIQAGSGTINNGLVPVRLMYPALEQSFNASNYQATSERIGGDNINSRVWWDK